MMRHRVVMGLLLLFALIWALLLPGRLSTPAIETFSSDAGEYHAGAVHLLQEGMYSLDGITPTVAREPGQSVFLAFIYAFFGIGNRIALFLVQGILVACSAWVFARQLARISSPRVGELFLLILFLLPSVYHSIFSALRESLALSLLMLTASGLLCLLHRPTWRTTTLTGVLLGGLLLTYAPYLLLPLFLVPFLLLLRLRVSHLIVLCIIPLLFAAAWGYRNAGVTGEACLTGCSRAAAAWYVRGEQAEQISGFEPVRCLWAEYISRDWSTVSFACSFNAVKNTKWPEGVPGDSSAIAAGKSGQQKILQHFGNYLWFSVFEIVELHLPFVDGWGRTYNVTVSIAMVLLYAGCLLALPCLRRRELLVLFALIAYTTGIFILTDATPRYLIPVIFCYAAVAAIGYNRLLSRFLWHP